MKDNRNYTISNKWIMRYDPYYFDTHSLYNIETRTLVKITPALFAFLSVFYHKAISYSTLYEYFISKGITLKWKNLKEVEKEFGLDNFFIQSEKEYHTPSVSSNIRKIKNIPIASTPVDVELLLTHNCNLRCKHCFQSSEAHSDKRIPLSVDEWFSIFKQFETANIYSVIISGGEPMMYPNFEELLRRISKLNISISILTNGMLISERNVRLFQNKNIAITISLDGGTKQDHEFLRGKNTFDVLERKISLLTSKGVKLNIAHTINKHNVKHLEQTIRYLIAHGIKSLSVNFVEPEGRATANDDLLLSPTEERKALEEIRKLESNYRNSISIDFPNLSYKKDTISFSNQPNIFCAAGTKRIAISTDGEVYPCVYAFDIPFLKVGDLKKESLQEIWEKHEAWNFMRGGIKLSQIEGCANCKLNSACSMRNCRIKSYTVKNGIYAKPHNCLIDKIN